MITSSYDTLHNIDHDDRDIIYSKSIIITLTDCIKV